MYEIDVPIKGEAFLKEKFSVIQNELENTTDIGFLKTNYRNHIPQLVDRIEADYDPDFWGEIKWVWNHLNQLHMTGDMWISDTEYLDPLPVYKGFNDIAEQFKTYVDVHSPIDEVNFPVSTYESLKNEILKEKGRMRDNPDPSLRGLNAVVVFDHNRALETLKKIHRVSLTTFKQRIYLEALTLALSYTPTRDNNHVSGESLKKNSNDDSRGNPNWIEKSKGFNFWKGVADKANRMMKLEPEKYQPRSDKHFISTNLKTDLSLHFEVGETTVRDNLEKYFKKNNRLFVPKNGY